MTWQAFQNRDISMNVHSCRRIKQTLKHFFNYIWFCANHREKKINKRLWHVSTAKVDRRKLSQWNSCNLSRGDPRKRRLSFHCASPLEVNISWCYMCTSVGSLRYVDSICKVYHYQYIWWFRKFVFRLRNNHYISWGLSFFYLKLYMKATCIP